MNDKLNSLLKESTKVYDENFKPIIWFGRCIFLSWYCDVGTCKFCYRSTIKDRIKHAKHARRKIASIITEGILAKNLNWRIEFLTGGYKIYPMDELVKIAKIVSEIFGEKIWLNLGALEKDDLEQFRPYIEGIVASLETIEPKLHKDICPNKPIEPYLEMFKNAGNLKKSITIVIGLGEKIEDIDLLHKFIEEHKLERITFYALKPVKDTPFKVGPDKEYYAEWIAKTRIRFPKLEIITGITARRIDDVPLLIRAGSNAITKFPATKKFNSSEAKKIESYIKENKREFIGSLTVLPDIDWNNEVDKLNIDEELKKETKEILSSYIEKMSLNKN